MYSSQEKKLFKRIIYNDFIEGNESFVRNRDFNNLQEVPSLNLCANIHCIKNEKDRQKNERNEPYIKEII